MLSQSSPSKRDMARRSDGSGLYKNAGRNRSPVRLGAPAGGFSPPDGPRSTPAPPRSRSPPPGRGLARRDRNEIGRGDTPRGPRGPVAPIRRRAGSAFLASGDPPRRRR